LALFSKSGPIIGFQSQKRPFGYHEKKYSGFFKKKRLFEKVTVREAILAWSGEFWRSREFWLGRESQDRWVFGRKFLISTNFNFKLN
jgi:hypothetical protein